MKCKWVIFDITNQMVRYEKIIGIYHSSIADDHVFMFIFQAKQNKQYGK